MPGGRTHAHCEPDKSTLARLGIRNFNPTLRKAAERLTTVHTPEGMPLPPNTLAELQRDMASSNSFAKINKLASRHQHFGGQLPEKRCLQLPRTLAVTLNYRDKLGRRPRGSRLSSRPIA